MPVQAEGRLGRRWFYFRFRHDCASLTIGSPNTRRTSGRTQRDRIKARRKLRRQVPMDSLDRFMATRAAAGGDDRLARFPEYRTRAAHLADVTGDPYAGALTTEEAAALFRQLIEQLQPVARGVNSYGVRLLSRTRRARTEPSVTGRHVITKNRKKS